MGNSLEQRGQSPVGLLSPFNYHPDGCRSQKMNLAMGDLALYGPLINAGVLNYILGLALEARGSELPPFVQKKQKEFARQIEACRDYVRNPNNYPPDTYDLIVGRYEKTDRETQGEGMETRVAQRIALFRGVNVAIDFDGTITRDHKRYIEDNEVIPGGRHAEPRLKTEGRSKFSDIYAETWWLLMADKVGVQIFREAAQQAYREKLILIREGVGRFFAYAKEIGAQSIIVSANHEPFVYGVLDQLLNVARIEEVEGTAVYAVSPDNMIAIDKATIVRHLALSNPDRALIFIGDGTTDIPALGASELIAASFALKGGDFAEELERRGLPYFSFTTFYDIINQLKVLRGKLG